MCNLRIIPDVIKKTLRPVRKKGKKADLSLGHCFYFVMMKKIEILPQKHDHPSVVISINRCTLFSNLPSLVEISGKNFNFEKDPIYKETLEMYTSTFLGKDEFTSNEITVMMKLGIYRLFILYQHDLPLINGQPRSVAAYMFVANYRRQKVYHIEYFAVSPSLRGKGIGSVMFHSIVNLLEIEAKRNDFTVMLTLECEQHLLSFYSRLGMLNSQLKPNDWKVMHGGKEQVISYYYMIKPLNDTNTDSKLYQNSYILNMRKDLNYCVHNYLKYR